MDGLVAVVFVTMDVRVMLSFGIAQRRADTAADKLLDKADLHLYPARNAGRNRVVA